MLTHVEGVQYTAISFTMGPYLGYGASVEDAMFYDTSYASLERIYHEETLDSLLSCFTHLQRVIIDTPEFALWRHDREFRDEQIAACQSVSRHKIVATQGGKLYATANHTQIAY